MINKKLKTHSQISMETRSKLYDRFEILLPKGEREKIKAYAQSKGLSLNEFIRQAIHKSMEE